MTQHPSTFLRAIAICMTLSSASAIAQQNQPFDFSYSVSGSTALRPSLIFNDGRDIYIQPSNPTAPIRVEGAKSSRQGPYVVIEGLPDSFVLVGAGKDRATVRYQGVSTPEVQVNPIAVADPQVAKPTPAVAATQPAPEQKKVETAIASAPAESRNPFAEAPGTCKPSTLSSTSNVAIEFGTGSTTLNAAGKQKLEAEASRQGLQSVRILTAADDTAKVRTARGIAIGNALIQAGITREMLSHDGHSAIPGMYEIEFTVSRSVPCIKGSPVVTFDNDRLTVIATESELSDVMYEVAQQMKRPLVVEGEKRPEIVSVQFASVPYLQALARIGNQIKGNATIVLRDKEIVLRY